MALTIVVNAGESSACVLSRLLPGCLTALRVACQNLAGLPRGALLTTFTR
ncbi:MAG: hypothetical protein ACP5HM_01875 [Anaerolineae bacterium]